MCRLFGLTAGRARVRATFWLLEAPDSLGTQSHRNPDGTGLGTFDATGRPVVEKQARAAYDDPAFTTEARDRTSTTFVAHVRHSTGTPIALENTHPFVVDGLIGAHNGAVGELAALEAHLGDAMADVQGQSDSERIIALVGAETRAHGGDVGTGLATAVGWIGAHLPVYAVNLVVIASTELWACRYPETHELWLLERSADTGSLQARTSTGTRIASEHLADRPSVVVASERLDDDPGWRLLEPGALVHVDADLRVTTSRVADPPARRLSL